MRLVNRSISSSPILTAMKSRQCCLIFKTCPCGRKPRSAFARAGCDDCGHDYFVAYSCKGLGVCSSRNTRRIVETAAHLTDRVFPRLPVRQPSDHWTSRYRALVGDSLRDIPAGHQQCRQVIVYVGFRAVGSNSWSSALSSKPVDVLRRIKARFMPLADRRTYAAIAPRTYGGQQCPFCETDLPRQQLVQESQLSAYVIKADLH